VLIDPDEGTIQRAGRVNARMLESMPEGWVLDDTHQPHITTLQRYVRSADLDQVFDAIEKTLAETDRPRSPTGPSRSRTPIGASRAMGRAPRAGQPRGAQLPGETGRRGITVRRISRHRGSVRDRPRRADQPDHHRWVEAFVPAQIGAGNYLPST
jgi:hypothetical protein